MSAPVLTSGPEWLDALRARGRARFAETGLPTRKDEAWKFTGLNKLRALALEPTPAPSPSHRSAAGPSLSHFVGEGLLHKAPLPQGGRGRGPAEGREGEGAAHRLVFVDGRFAPDLSEIHALSEGVILGGLSDLLAARPELIEPHLGRMAEIERRPMAALNAAWIADGPVLILPPGCVLDRPVEVAFLAGEGVPGACHPRHLVVLGRTAEAVLVERHLSGPAGGFTNGVAEIALGPGAALRHYVLHAEPDSALATWTHVAELARDAAYMGFVFTVGGGLVRHEFEGRLSGPGASCRLDGAYLVDGRRHADVTALIDHRAPHCSSRQTQKGVIDGAGHAVFQGKILVRPDAQKTDGNQLSQTLLLSPDAEIDVKPELEIYADDVKCSHGATSGRLDSAALFYLRARGIPENEARALLIQGFIDGALDEIDHQPVRDAFKSVAARWLASHAGREGST